MRLPKWKKWWRSFRDTIKKYHQNPKEFNDHEIKQKRLQNIETINSFIINKKAAKVNF